MKIKKLIKGFTLLETLITVVIISILAAIVYPSYLNSTYKSNRTEAKAALMDIAQRLQRCYTMNGSYSTGNCVVRDGNAGAGIASLATGVTTRNGQGFYIITLPAADLTATSFKLTARAVAGKVQSRDAVCSSFTLKNTGERAAFDSVNADKTTTCW